MPLRGADEAPKALPSRETGAVRPAEVPHAEVARVREAFQPELSGKKPLDPWGGVADRFESTYERRFPRAALEGQAHRWNIHLMEVETKPHLAPSASPEHSADALREGAGGGRVARSPEEAARALAKHTPYVFALDHLGADNLTAALGADALVLHGENADARRAVAALGKPAIALGPESTRAFAKAKVVAIDGSRGKWVDGAVPILQGRPSVALKEAIDGLRKSYGLQVTSQTSTPEGIRRAVSLGADGVRVDADAILESPRALPYLRKYLLATEAAPKRNALEHLLVSVRDEAKKLLDAAGPVGVSFALGGRSPSSFFPSRPEELDALSGKVGLPAELVRERVGEMGAGNSKLGLRGARWGVKDPDLFAAIARGIFEAQAEALESGQKRGDLRVLLSSVGLEGEIRLVKARLEKERTQVENDFGVGVPVTYGAGIDTARGALSAGGISKHAGYLEYSLGGMTESMFGMSRDDAKPYLPKMVGEGIVPADPFEHLDATGVGGMVKVGQFLAGDRAFDFPATLSGEQALEPNGMLLASQVGSREVTVPVDETLSARLAHAQSQDALGASQGLRQPDPRTRDQSAKVFDILTERPTAPAIEGPPKGLPEGVSPLDYAEGLVAQVASGKLSSADALMKVPVDLVDQLGKPIIDPKAKVEVLAGGLPASPGTGQGRVAFTAEKAAEYERAGEPYVLVVNELHAEDVSTARKAKGLLSVRGGKTSHAAMIAANSDVPCVMNEKVRINLEAGTATIGRKTVKEGDWITLDGTKGQVIEGKPPLLNPTNSEAFSTLMKWTDEHRTLAVMANADTPEEAARAFKRGASGVGLVLSEHMFYEADRLPVFRSVILSEPGARPADIATLEKVQTDDYRALFEAADGKPVSVRLLDPPLYEFLPHQPAEIKSLADRMGLTPDEVAKRISGLQEVDSMLGTRGVRLELVRPDIEAMQVRALAKAYVDTTRAGKKVAPLHIVVPQLSNGGEIRAARERVMATVASVAKESGMDIPVELGAMIETPRGALDAGEMARYAQFFSYGTNDLTQTTLGYGRNVAAKFVPDLIAAGALKADPTGTLDRDAVGKMIEVAEFLGRDSAKDPLKSGICGAQGGDPESIRLVQELGLDYVSVPPAQVAKARLAAAQAAIESEHVTVSGAEQIDLLTAKLSRSLGAITRMPIPPEQGHVANQLELYVRRAADALASVDTSDPAAAKAFAPLMKQVAAARAVLDQSRMIDAITIELPNLANQAARVGVASKVAASLTEAREALKELSEGSSSLLTSATTSANAQRDVASHAWAALRAMEAVRSAIGDVELSGDAEYLQRLRHRNDDWDNNHYTRLPPQAGEPFGTYLKRVSKAFLADNDITTRLVGAENLPKDRPIIFAVSHRSGAIDRFISMSTLPVDDDKFMYMVREGSPLDVIARKTYGEGNKWIIPAKGRDETAEKLAKGFAAGAKVAITYPEGTGTLGGEARYPATGTAAMALKTGAVIVPVTIDDTFSLTPFRGGTVNVQLHKPIDPVAVQKAVGAGPDSREAVDLMHTLMQYELGKGYRSLL